ncbi:AraC family transcriptional regulator [Luteibacter aegosomatissinici]|uniref:AraC family transcriptional regulator n=1 Tax=Luteibacter aegosomatissinici TaxID=2911539 RepID=UPI001FFB42ED|nr:AraC family transcriptional regulator [Luteibacter aegosomatissinici]UPG92458.1 AraC family transcriptional regulator [Luteibacter aegosomatissinici]
MSADPFSDILKFTQAESLVTGGFSASNPWALRFPPPSSIKFFAVVKGGCWVTIEGEPEPIWFGTGDVGLITAKRGLVLASDLGVPPLDAMAVFSGSGKSVAALGDGQDFTHIGGHVLLDPASGRLLADVLPAWIHVSAESPQATSFRWLLAELVAERRTDLPGNQLAAAQLSQLLFIQILRAHLQTSGPMPAGWLRAIGDPRIAPAMRLMHADPSRSWSLDELAEACAMSRTTFANRFRDVAGSTPLAYLSGWRMHLATRALREGKKPVAVLAQELGYSSESAFSTAFKRAVGESPRSYRLGARAHEEVLADAVD